MEDQNRSREDEWFRKNEKELIESAQKARQKREEERAAREKQEELQRLKDLHFMKCPKCGHDMKEEALGGLTIDKCTFCEGVYFDAGELEQAYLSKPEERRGLMRKLIGI